ncbi:MAG: hypothetical protein IJV16_10475, partial [Lachnospiraceae bacterium]|nr:hypothetical protein [Lachnospiraceae bacterium]
MSSDEEYLDRLLQSIENKESEIKTDVLPDIPDVQQDLVMPADIETETAQDMAEFATEPEAEASVPDIGVPEAEEPFDVLAAMNDIDISEPEPDTSDHMVEEMRTPDPTPNLDEP